MAQTNRTSLAANAPWRRITPANAGDAVWNGELYTPLRHNGSVGRVWHLAVAGLIHRANTLHFRLFYGAVIDNNMIGEAYIPSSEDPSQSFYLNAHVVALRDNVLAEDDNPSYNQIKAYGSILTRDNASWFLEASPATYNPGQDSFLSLLVEGSDPAKAELISLEALN